jgi:phage repressor protein C with HTH and peptisase S24 domain
MAKFILVGDICHCGRVEVEADSLEEATKKADGGDFSVYDESGKPLRFEWNGDEESVEKED